MPAQPTFGPRIGRWHVEEAMMQTLRERLPTYVDASARLVGIDPVAPFAIRPKTLCRRSPFSGFPKVELPLVEVCGGPAGPMTKGASGLFMQTRTINVVCYVAGRDFDSTSRILAAWEMAIPWCIEQSQSLGGLSMAVDLLDEDMDQNMASDGQRTLQGYEAIFAVTVPGVLDPSAGPASFIPDPGSGDPAPYDPPVTIESVEIDLETMP